MNKKPAGLLILSWAEIILALRVLLFALPVFLNRILTKKLTFTEQETFLFTLAGIALLLLIAGIMTVLGHKQWRSLHYLMAFGVTAVSFVFIGFGIAGGGRISPFYYLPVIFALLVLLYMWRLKKQAVL